jgi:hypothetical protein
MRLPASYRRSLVAAPVLAALLAGCGSSSKGPHLARADAAPLINLSQRIPGEAACAQARDIHSLQRDAVRLVNAHRVPRALQETLVGGVNALAAQAPPCLPPVPAVIAPAGEGRGHGHGHGRHHGDGGDGGGD